MLEEWRDTLEANPNVDFWQEMVTGLLIEDGKAVGVKTSLGLEIKSKSVVLTNGTFLNGLNSYWRKTTSVAVEQERAHLLVLQNN